MTAAAAATPGGAITLVNGDADEGFYDLSLRGRVDPFPTVQYVDNGGTGFTHAGTWTHSTAGYLRDSESNSRGSGTDTATWSFPVQPGQYQVYATWTTSKNRATNAPYTVYDGLVLPAASLGTVAINQERAPNDLRDQATNWERLGTYTVAGNRLSVQLTDKANENVVADAIRIERIVSGQSQSAATMAMASDPAALGLLADEALRQLVEFGAESPSKVVQNQETAARYALEALTRGPRDSHASLGCRTG